MNRARYTWRNWEGGVLTIIDRDIGGPSVSNDVKQVIRDLAGFGIDVDTIRIVCRDSDGLWDGIATLAQEFAGWIPLRASNMHDAIRAAAVRAIWEVKS